MHVCGVRPLFSGVAAPLGCVVLLSICSHCISQLTDCERLFTYLSDIGEVYTITEKRCYIRSNKVFLCRW